MRGPVRGPHRQMAGEERESQTRADAPLPSERGRFLKKRLSAETSAWSFLPAACCAGVCGPATSRQGSGPPAKRSAVDTGRPSSGPVRGKRTPGGASPRSRRSCTCRGALGFRGVSFKAKAPSPTERLRGYHFKVNRRSLLVPSPLPPLRQCVPRPGPPTRPREPVVLTQPSTLATPGCLGTQPARASAGAGHSCPVLPKAGPRLQ